MITFKQFKKSVAYKWILIASSGARYYRTGPLQVVRSWESASECPSLTPRSVTGHTEHDEKQEDVSVNRTTASLFLKLYCFEFVNDLDVTT